MRFNEEQQKVLQDKQLEKGQYLPFGQEVHVTTIQFAYRGTLVAANDHHYYLTKNKYVMDMRLAEYVQGGPGDEEAMESEFILAERGATTAIWLLNKNTPIDLLEHRAKTMCNRLLEMGQILPFGEICHITTAQFAYRGKLLCANDTHYYITEPQYVMDMASVKDYTSSEKPKGTEVPMGPMVLVERNATTAIWTLHAK